MPPGDQCVHPPAGVPHLVADRLVHDESMDCTLSRRILSSDIISVSTRWYTTSLHEHVHPSRHRAISRASFRVAEDVVDYSMDDTPRWDFLRLHCLVNIAY